METLTASGSFEKIMAGVAEASVLLVKNLPFEETLAALVRIMGSSAQADRCYIFQNSQTNNALYMNQLAEWTAAGISIQLHNPGLQEVPYSIHPFLQSVLEDGMPFTAQVAQMPEPFRSLMAQQDIQSFLFLPIRVKDAFWGYIGYDACNYPRIWQDFESDALQTLANAFGFYIENQELRNALQNSNRRFNLAISGSKDGIWELDLTTGESFLSDLWLEIFGYQDDPGPWTYAHWLSKLHPHDLDRVDKEYTAYLEGGHGTIDLNYRYQHGQGHYVWVHSRAAAEWDELGRPVRMAGSDADITEGKLQAEVLAENERQYRNLVNNLQEVVFESDADGNFVFLNKSWETLTGYSLEETIGRPGTEFVHPSETPKIPAWREAIDSHPSKYIHLEVQYKHKKGHAIWAEVTAKRVFDQDGKMIGTTGTLIDLTPRRQAERMLQISEAKYRLISENITDVVTQHDEQGHLTFASPSLLEILGYDPQEVLGLSPIGYIHPHDLDNLIQQGFKKLMEGKKRVSISYRVRHKSGRYIWMESITRILRGSKGEFIAIQASSRDISSRKKAEQEVARALEKEKELMELRSRFIMMASHEFRTPLATIRSSLDLMRMYIEAAEPNIKAKTHKHFDKIQLEIERVGDLMNDILLLGKLEAGKTSLNLQACYLHTLVENVIDHHFSSSQSERVPELHIEGAPVSLQVDEQLMGHCLINLIGNALKFSPGQEAPIIHVQYGRHKAVVHVTDFGIGIPVKDKKRIFEPFYRASNTDKIPGSGLGLVVVKEFVHRHGGVVYCKSKPSKGTTFTIELKS